MSGQPLKLVVGLGNPGAEYARTRHNAGFWFVDELARRGGGAWRRESRHQCELARVRIEGGELWLAKPATYMNHSGNAVQSVAAFYRIAPAEVLVVHDDIDLPPGVARLKQGGGHGGHNGVRDVISQLGADFWRLRIGVGHPAERAEVINYVLHPPRQEETGLISGAIERSLEVWPLIQAGEMEKAMHRLHTQPKD